VPWETTAVTLLESGELSQSLAGTGRIGIGIGRSAPTAIATFHSAMLFPVLFLISRTGYARAVMQNLWSRSAQRFHEETAHQQSPLFREVTL
jgi:hypothetical protein